MSRYLTGLLRVALVTALAITTMLIVVSFILSFATLTDLAGRCGIAKNLTWLFPLAVDGAIVLSTVAVVALSGGGAQFKDRLFFWFTLGVSASISIAGNVLHGASEHTLCQSTTQWLPVSIAAVAPVMLVVSTHGLAVLSRLRSQRDDPVDDHDFETSHPDAIEEEANDEDSAALGAVDYSEMADELVARGSTTLAPNIVADILTRLNNSTESARRIAASHNIHHSRVIGIRKAALAAVADRQMARVKNAAAGDSGRSSDSPRSYRGHAVAPARPRRAITTLRELRRAKTTIIAPTAIMAGPSKAGFDQCPAHTILPIDGVSCLAISGQRRQLVWCQPGASRPAAHPSRQSHKSITIGAQLDRRRSARCSPYTRPRTPPRGIARQPPQCAPRGPTQRYRKHAARTATRHRPPAGD